MAKNSINISLKDTFESMVLIGVVEKTIWTGVIDSDLVDEILVENDDLRARLKKLIQELEKIIFDIRNLGPKNAVMENYLKAQELSNQIYEIVASGGVDVELYLIYLVQKFDEIKRNVPGEFARINSKCRTQMEINRKTILSQNAVFGYPVFLSEKDEYSFETILVREQEGKIKKKEGAKKLLEFVKTVYGDEELPEELEMDVLDEINSKMLIPDILEAVHSPAVKSLLYDTILRNYLKRLGLSRTEIDGSSSQELVALVEKFREDDEDGKVYNQTLTDALITHIDYISVDKFVVAYLYRILEEYRRTIQISYDFKDIFAEVKLVQELLSRILNSKIIQINSASVMVNGDMRNITVRELKRFEKDFREENYFTPEILALMKEMLFKNRSNLEECSEKVIGQFDYELFDLEIISLVDFRNLKRLFELGKIDKTFLNRLVRNCNFDIYTELQKEDGDTIFDNIEFPSKMELVRYLYSNGLINEKDLFEYYSLTELSLEDIDILESGVENKEEFRGKLKAQIDEFELMSRYKEFIEAQIEYEKALKEESPDLEVYRAKLETKRREKDKLLLFYRKYRGERTEEEKIEFLDNVLFEHCVNNEEEVVVESLREMYKDAIVSLEDIEYIDSSYLEQIIMEGLFARGELNLEDTDKIKNSISASALKGLILKIIKKQEISRSQKFILIMNVYNTGTKEDLDTANELLEELRLVYSEELEHSDTKTKTKPKKPVIEGDPKGKKPPRVKGFEWVYPRHIKWKFLKALDKDAEIKLYAGGYVEVHSKKLDVRIIEKYFETDRYGDDFGLDAYGSATYILSEADYRQNVGDLVIQRACRTKMNGKEQTTIEEYMNREALTSIVPRTDRIRHNTHSETKNWMREIARYFGIDLETDLELVVDERYSKEELEELRRVIEEYGNTYIDRNEAR